DMKLRRALAACALTLGAVALAVQTPSDVLAQDGKAKKAKQKLAKEEVKAPVADRDAKPAPSEVKPPAAPAHPMPTAELVRTIDRHIDARLASAQVRPSALTSDAEFLRRASLDIAGVIPTAEQAAAFLDD